MTIEMKLSQAALNKVIQNSSADSQPFANSSGSSSFKEVMEAQLSGAEMSNMLGMDNMDISPGSSMQAINANAIQLDTANMNIGLESPEGSQKIVQMLSQVNEGQLQMDSMVNQILYSDKRFSNQELLAIQAHVFNLAQMTELTVKVAEQGVNSIKTIQNTQVQ